MPEPDNMAERDAAGVGLPYVAVSSRRERARLLGGSGASGGRGTQA
ncbi:hypothetical protein [Streptomyces microflavus]